MKKIAVCAFVCLFSGFAAYAGDGSSTSFLDKSTVSVDATQFSQTGDQNNSGMGAVGDYVHANSHTPSWEEVVIGGVKNQGSGGGMVEANANEALARIGKDSGLYFGVHIGVNSNPEGYTFTPVAPGLMFQSHDHNTRLGLFAAPWEGRDSAFGAQEEGHSSSIDLMAEHDFHNWVVLKGRFEKSIISGMGAKPQISETGTYSTSCSQTSSSTTVGQNCTDTSTDVQTETSAGFRQVGSGSGSLIDVSALFPIGKHGFVEAQAIYDKTGYKGVPTHQTQPDGDIYSVNHGDIQYRVGAGWAF